VGEDFNEPETGRKFRARRAAFIAQGQQVSIARRDDRRASREGEIHDHSVLRIDWMRKHSGNRIDHLRQRRKLGDETGGAG
jgi:hypothetical protein